jgi:hypothetical protein
VLKNFPKPDELLAALSSHVQSVTIEEWTYYWSAVCRTSDS